MLSQPERACLVIADISGYTSYLAGVELDHAQDILADLIDTVVAALRPTFRLAKLEGDAAFAYALTESVDVSTLQDQVEGCYFAFRRRLRDIRQATSCECNACILIPSLDLKLLVHHGSIVRQRMAGMEELVGSDVIVIHRLLKNAVEADLGLHAYALYTDACLRVAGVDAPAGLGLRRHAETYEVIGEVVGWVRDLEAAWTAEQERARVRVGPDQAIWEYERVLPAPPAVVWEYMTTPGLRVQWQAGVTGVEESTAGGRRGIGTTNHCIHGRDAIVEEILDWEPPSYLTMRMQMPYPGFPKMVMSDALTPEGDGTRLIARILRPRSARERKLIEGAGDMLGAAFGAGIDNLEPLLVTAQAERSARAEAAEPALPHGAERYLEPMAG
jgi:uncharacterized protein YndB with AHSA1/START domain